MLSEVVMCFGLGIFVVMKAGWQCWKNTTSHFQWDYNLKRDKTLQGKGVSYDFFSAAYNTPVLSITVIARGTTHPCSNPLRNS